MESCTTDATGTVTAAVLACSTNPEVTGPAGPDQVLITPAGAAGYSIDATSKSTGHFLIAKSNTAPGSYTRTCTGSTKGCSSTGTW